MLWVAVTLWIVKKICQIIVELLLLVGCGCMSSIKINNSILWELLGFMEFTIKHITYFIIIYKLHTIQSWYQQNNKYEYLCIFFSPRELLLKCTRTSLRTRSFILCLGDEAECPQKKVTWIAVTAIPCWTSSLSRNWLSALQCFMTLGCLLPQQDLVSTDWYAWIKTLHSLGYSLVSLQQYLLVGFQREPEVMSILPLASSRHSG